MCKSLIWLDRHQMKIFRLDAGAMEKNHLPFPPVNPHSRDGDRERQRRELFRRAVAAIGAADHLVLAGPGVAKHHFRSYLREQYPLLERKSAVVEGLDQATEEAVQELLEKYFATARA